jgi:hypothetical protein
LEKLFKQDPQAYGNLTAKTSAPSSKGLIVSTVVNLLFRIIIITALAWFCMHPKIVFGDLFQSPDSIALSVELQTPEAILSIFFPFILIIPLISMIIRITKQSKLKEMLRIEEIQRSGLTEEEFQELERKRTQVAQEEVTMARDADIAATAQASQDAASASSQNQGNP